MPSGEGGDLQQHKEGTQGEAWGTRSSHPESGTSATVTTQPVNNRGDGKASRENQHSTARSHAGLAPKVLNYNSGLFP